MFCSDCGKKNKESAKFCASCGASLSAAKAEKNEGALKSTVAGKAIPKPKKPMGTCGWLITVFLLLAGLFIIAGAGGVDFEVILGFAAWVASLVFLGLVIAVIIKAIRSGFKNTKKSIISIVVLGVVLLGSYFAYRSYVYNQILDRVGFIQDKVAEIAAAKLLGDTFMKSGNIPVGGVTLADVNNAAAAEKTRLSEVSYPSSLDGYVNSVSAWADKIAAAKDYNSWNALSDGPEKFDIQISNSWATGIFKQTFYDIAAIKDAGDYAIKTQDRSAMRFVAARLIAIDHLLVSIETYQTVAVKEGFISPVYADYLGRGNAVIKTRRLCFMNGRATTCLPEAEKAVKNAKDVAKNLYRSVPPGGYTAEPDPNISQTGWNGSFGPIADAINTANLQYLGGAGLGVGQPATDPQFPPRVQAFRNNCRARGGNPDPTSLVKERLPTTEGGYNCQIGGCWEFMTASSGRIYAGGNPGCPEQGLVPRAPVIPNPIPNIIPTPNPTPAPVVTSYDGTYSVRYSYGNCGTNIQGVNLGNLGVFNDTLTVRNNVVSWSGGQSAKINSSGRATWSMNLSGIGSIQQTFNFTKSGVSGTFTFSVSTQGVGVSCNGSFTGTKL